MNSYPRLDQFILLRLIQKFRVLALERPRAVIEIRDLVEESVLAPGRISHSSVGIQLIDLNTLQQLRDDLRTVAEKYGYPGERFPQRSPMWANYDRETAGVLHAEMEILPSDAGSRDVWAHMNGWLVPDLVMWRWWIADSPEDGDSVGEGDPRFGWGSRWFHRNQMGRLWWRQEVLGELYSGGQIGEDQVTAVVERPSLGFNPPLAQAICKQWSSMLDGLQVSSEDLMRDATKRLRRILPSVAVYSMSEAGLSELVAAAFSESSEALLRRLSL
jgi:hypothetical protein